MPIYKNQDTNTWYVICWYTHWTGERKQKCKRGFPTKKAAAEWERQFLMQKQANIDMSFEAFYELYKKDIQPKLKENTWLTKENIITKKILPYFGTLFGEALKAYNAKQTRSNRVIKNYYEKIRTSKQEKPFHEVIFQIGNKDDMNAQSEEGQLAAKILDEFMNRLFTMDSSFSATIRKRWNPSLRI